MYGTRSLHLITLMVASICYLIDYSTSVLSTARNSVCHNSEVFHISGLRVTLFSRSGSTTLFLFSMRASPLGKSYS